jgi:archaellum biogenesis protein FlaJ (TadC family)
MNMISKATRLRIFLHRVGAQMLRMGYFTTTLAGFVALVAAILYTHGFIPGFFSSPILSGLMFALGAVALLLEVVGKALAPMEPHWAEVYVRARRAKRNAKPMPVDIPLPHAVAFNS